MFIRIGDLYFRIVAHDFYFPYVTDLRVKLSPSRVAKTIFRASQTRRKRRQARIDSTANKRPNGQNPLIPAPVDPRDCHPNRSVHPGPTVPKYRAPSPATREIYFWWQVTPDRLK